MACGRLLRDEESKRLRIGPHCLKRLQSRLAPRPREHHTPATHDASSDQLAFDLEDEDEDDWWDGVYRIIPSDLWGQGVAGHRLYGMTDVPLTGSYL